MVPAPPERVFEFLADLRNHWRLESRFAELGGVGADGGHVRVKGPLGISRSARTRVVEAKAAGTAAGGVGTLRGRADVGRGTVGLVAWDLAPAAGGGTHVRLAATVERASPGDRALLALGGRRWLAHLFRRALQQLE